ncbi:hypothetical protein EW026_g8131 [Hermanssonia centrifuga]|uniref:Uncharacterized protein n=1 Tax=Hermanssonia centrifuga TaxID=98765 RepID=A0A4S4K5F8_9APHY|nr:hypothetical protein EW026_g8131 [Hermanssonia centrifuga]
MPQPIGFFVASHAAAIIKHTKHVLYLEDDDIAHIAQGELHIHSLPCADGRQVASQRTIKTFEIELAEIMKGKFNHFMQKEIYEQPESSVNTMHASRVNFDQSSPLVVSKRIFLLSIMEGELHSAPVEQVITLSLQLAPSWKN